MRPGACCSGTEVQEKEANYFAMRLLVPDKFLEKEPSIDLTKDEEIVRMARRYKVAIGVMAFRLGEFYAEKSKRAKL